MKTQTNSLTPDQSIELIAMTLSNFRKNYRTKSQFFLLWGWIITAASISHFLLLRRILAVENYDQIGIFSLLNWTVFVFAGLIFQFILLRRIIKDQRTTSHLDRFYSILWMVSAITFVLIGILCLRFKIYPSPFILCIAGMATLISGWVLRFRPLLLGGITLFIFAGIASFVLNEYQLLVNAAAIILGYLIPGYLLRNTNE